MPFQPQRTFRYYYPKFIRLQGDPVSLARGVALGTFIGITPTIPFHTIAIILLAGLLRGNLIATLLAATVVSNPLTFFFQYYFSWRLGSIFFPCDLSWERIQALMDRIGSDGSFTETLRAFADLGQSTTITLLLGDASWPCRSPWPHIVVQLSVFHEAETETVRKTSADLNYFP
ncbi:MAG: DUF2062 domain-containing protein [Syntrophales bacterium]